MRMITKEQVKERVRAFAVFTGIAIGAVSGFELIITGGFDPLTPRIMFADETRDTRAPSAQERFAYSETHRDYAPTAYVGGDAYDVTPTSLAFAENDLAGAPGEEPTAYDASVPTPSSAELYAEIDRLYREEAPAPSSHVAEEGWDGAEIEEDYAVTTEAYAEDMWTGDLR